MAGQRIPRNRLDSERRRAVLTGTTIALAGLTATAVNATEPEVLDEEFLEYLAEFDDKDDDWSWFDTADEKTVTKPEKPDPTRPEGPDTRSQAKPEEKPEP